jgi:catechol 2,3-dioxygenase-like lactoylglutathione lyase family enzyme
MKFTFLPHIAVQAADLNEAKKFYTDVLGMELLDENTGELKLGSSDTTFYVEQNTGNEVCFAFEVDSLSDAKKLLEENKCVITSESKEGFMVTDPHGLSYYVSEISKTR